MPNNQADGRIPGITVTLELAPALGLAPDEAGLRERVRERLAAELARLLDGLGIPGRPEITLIVPDAKAKADWSLMRVTVNGRPCLYDREILEQVYRYVMDLGLDACAPPVYLCKDDFWQQEDKRESLAEFLTLGALEIIKSRPSVLLGPEQFASYVKSLGDIDAAKEGTTGPSEADARLHGVLSDVLDMRIAIADRQKVVSALRGGPAEEGSAGDVGEALISSLTPGVVELRLPSAYFKEMSSAEQGTAQDAFALVRDGLFYELGMRYPRFHFVIDDGLKPQTFAFRINHLTTTPQKGLPPSRCLVNAGDDRLGPLGIKGESVVAPLKGKLFSTIDAGDRDRAKEAGLTVWGQTEYLALCLSVELRNNGRCLVNSERVQAELDELGKAFPALVNALKLKLSTAHLTRVLRALAAEDLSVRNLRLILERLLDFDYIVIDPLTYFVLDSRLAVSEPPAESWLAEPETMVAFIRTGMKRYISHKYLQGRSTLPVYLLDKDIEEALSSHTAPGVGRELKGERAESQRQDILQAVRAQIGDLPPTASPPIILTTSNVRSAFREVVAPEFPKLSVLCYEELTAETFLQPVARLSLDAEAS